MKFGSIRQYCLWMESINRASTLSSYKRSLIRFAEWLDMEELKPLQITHADLLKFQRYLSEVYKRPDNREPLAIGTQATWLAGIKSFYGYLYKSGRVAIDPSRKIRLPKVPKTEISCDHLTQQEAMAMIYTQTEILNVKQKHSPYWALEYRNLTHLCFGLATGRRRSSLRNIKVSDLDFDRNEIRIEWEKGSPGRVFPVSSWAMDIARGFIDDARSIILKERKDPGWLFVATRTDRVCGEYLTRLVTKIQVETVKQNPDLEELADKQLCSHSLRVTFATSLMFLNGAGIRIVNDLLLHKQLSTSAQYTPIEIADLRRACKKAHPRA